MKTITIFCDGSCLGNPGPGGWAAIIISDEGIREISGGVPATTNNQMELRAAIEGLRALEGPSEVLISTDSRYVRTGICRWLKKWKANGWKTKDRKPVKNQELWEQLDAEVAKHRITWKWVKGHSGDKLNERCDNLAKSEISKLRQQSPPDQPKMRLQKLNQCLDGGAA